MALPGPLVHCQHIVLQIGHYLPKPGLLLGRDLADLGDRSKIILRALAQSFGWNFSWHD